MPFSIFLLFFLLFFNFLLLFHFLTKNPATEAIVHQKNTRFPDIRLKPRAILLKKTAEADARSFPAVSKCQASSCCGLDLPPLR